MLTHKLLNVYHSNESIDPNKAFKKVLNITTINFKPHFVQVIKKRRGLDQAGPDKAIEPSDWLREFQKFILKMG